MADTLKIKVARRVMALVRDLEGDQTLDRTRCETALRRRGMKPGNAQRLLDDTSDVQLARLVEVAGILGVQPADLLSGIDRQPCTQPPMPTRPTLEDALEVLGMALAKDMPEDVREDLSEALAKLAQRKGLHRHQEDVIRLLTATPGKAQARSA